MVTKRLYEKEKEWSRGQIKTCRKTQHVKIDNMEEMPNSICGNTAVGGNYNSTCDSIGWHFERDINTGQYIAECSRKDGNSDLIIIAHLCACDGAKVENVDKILRVIEEE